MTTDSHQQAKQIMDDFASITKFLWMGLAATKSEQIAKRDRLVAALATAIEVRRYAAKGDDRGCCFQCGREIFVPFDEPEAHDPWCAFGQADEALSALGVEAER